MVDLVEDIFGQLGIEIEVRALPYKDSIEMATRGEIAGVLGTYPISSPGLVYPNQALGLSTEGFVTLGNSDWRYLGPESLSTIRYGTVEGYTHPELTDYVLANEGSERIDLLSGGDDIYTTRRNLEKLLAGTIDAVFDDVAVLRFNINLLGLKENMRFAGELEQASYTWLAFSPSVPRLAELCKGFDDALLAMRQSGKLDFLLSRYGMRD